MKELLIFYAPLIAGILFLLGWTASIIIKELHTLSYIQREHNRAVSDDIYEHKKVIMDAIQCYLAVMTIIISMTSIFVYNNGVSWLFDNFFGIEVEVWVVFYLMLFIFHILFLKKASRLVNHANTSLKRIERLSNE
jgi:Na+(H+)/acetate symporter ActP